jgi:hypothetical protein
MRNKLYHGWKRVPSVIRKPIVMVLGLLLVILAGLTGPLPGPGGIPLFLVAIALLATEFTWAAQVRDKVLQIIHFLGKKIKKYPKISTVIIAFCVAGAATGYYFLFKYIL